MKKLNLYFVIPFALLSISACKILSGSNLSSVEFFENTGCKLDADGTPQDQAIYFMGGVSYANSGNAPWTMANEVYKSTDAETFTQISRLPYAVSGLPVVFNKKIFMIALIDASTKNIGYQLSSSDGITWETSTSNLSVNVNTSGTLVHNGKIWIIGGVDTDDNDVATVQSSSDGYNWTKEADLPVTVNDAKIISFNGKMIVAGGKFDGTGTDQIYYSTDGSSWTLASTTLPAVSENYIGVGIFKNKAYIIGDDSTNLNIFESSDGITWTDTGSVVPAVRFLSNLFPFKGFLYRFGGLTTGAGFPGSKSVVYSSDGREYKSKGDIFPNLTLGSNIVIFSPKCGTGTNGRY